MSTFRWPILFLAVSSLAVAVVSSNIAEPLRAVTVVPYILIVPGLSWVRLLRLNNRLSELTLAIAMSITMTMFVATAMVYLDSWLPSSGFALLIFIGLAGVLLQLALDVRQSNPPPKS